MAFSQVSTKLFACGLKDRSPYAQIRIMPVGVAWRTLVGGVFDFGSFNVEGALLVFR